MVFNLRKGTVKNSTLHRIIANYQDYFTLIILNIIAHYLFIGYFKFVSDDWTQLVFSNFHEYSYLHLLFESQRSGQYILMKIASDMLGGVAIWYHLLNLILSTILLLIVYETAKSLLKNLFLKPGPYAFLFACLFCLLFNKDQLYYWADLFYDNIAYILYFSSFYLYINSAKSRYYVFLSWLFYGIAVFIYEIGILLPVVFLFYEILQQKLFSKKLVWFTLPPIAYMLIRITNWFGYGWKEINHTPNYFTVHYIFYFLGNLVHDLITSFGVSIVNVGYGILGLVHLNPAVILLLILLDVIISILICKYIIKLFDSELTRVPEYKDKVLPFAIFCLIGITLSYITLAANGVILSRYLLIIDFFIVLIVLYILIRRIKEGFTILVLVFTLCLLLNQGLSINWVISGDIQDSVNKGIAAHSTEIGQKPYFFVNASELYDKIPNYVFSIGPCFAIQLNQYSDQVYYPYLNSEGLAEWSVNSMMSGAHINTSSTLLIYGSIGNVFVSSDNGTITYINSDTGNYSTILFSQYYEGNSSNLLGVYNNRIKSNWIFTR